MNCPVCGNEAMWFDVYGGAVLWLCECGECELVQDADSQGFFTVFVVSQPDAPGWAFRGIWGKLSCGNWCDAGVVR